ncbi:MAG: hypothetical protein EBZ47_05770 [Chlamydiae bacterium]|nr:hypothetical protein [Chlamydiota bacterium]
MKISNLFFLVTSIATSCFLVFYGMKQREYEKTDGFSLKAITSHRKFDEAFTPPPLTLEEQRELAVALHQPYTYLSQGHHSFVFTSADQQYVIKLIKGENNDSPTLFSFLYHLFKQKHKSTPKHTLAEQSTRQSYHLASCELKMESALLFTHLNKTKNLRQKLACKDKQGNLYDIPLDEHEFILQKRAIPLTDLLKSYLQNHQIDLAKDLTHKLFSLLSRCYHKGISAHDLSYLKDIGYSEDALIFMKLGTLTKSPSDLSELIKIAGAKISEGLKKDYPEIESMIDGCANSFLAATSEE